VSLGGLLRQRGSPDPLPLKPRIEERFRRAGPFVARQTCWRGVLRTSASACPRAASRPWSGEERLLHLRDANGQALTRRSRADARRSRYALRRSGLPAQHRRKRRAGCDRVKLGGDGIRAFPDGPAYRFDRGQPKPISDGTELEMTDLVASLLAMPKDASLTWLVISGFIGGFLAHFIAVAGRWFTRPRLRFQVGSTAPFVIQGPTDKSPTGSAWIRVRVDNRGWRNAEVCRVYLTDVFMEDQRFM
jgi:hypothetical protein